MGSVVWPLCTGFRPERTMSQQRLNAVIKKGDMLPFYPRGMERSSSVLPSFSSQPQRCPLFTKLMWKTFCVVSRSCERMVRCVRTIANQPLVFYTIFWTSFLAVSVTVAALSLEMGFSASISSHAPHLEACTLLGSSSISCRHCLGLPLDGPNDQLCVPALRFKKSSIDFIVPPIFAGLVVTGSALLVQSLHLFSE